MSRWQHIFRQRRNPLSYTNRTAGCATIIPSLLVQEALLSNTTTTTNTAIIATTKPPPPNRLPPPSSKLPPPLPPKTTTTTAAKFFGSIKPSTTVATTKATVPSSNTSSITSRRQQHDEDVTMEDGKENNSIAKTASAVKNGNTKTVAKNDKNSKSHPPIKHGTIGNADDFIGDIDDDEDDEDDAMDVEGAKEEMEDDLLVPHQTKRTRKSKNQHPRSMDDDAVMMGDENYETEKVIQAKPIVKGAMDAFTITTAKTADATKKDADDAAPIRRRRKVLVHQTVRDEHGYFITKQVEEWQDIDPNEEADEDHHHSSLLLSSKQYPKPDRTTTTVNKNTNNSSSTSSHPKNSNQTKNSKTTTKQKKSSAAQPHSMKQGSLKGFFTKK